MFIKVGLNMGETKPSMTGNGNHIPSIKECDNWGMVYGFVLPVLMMFNGVGGEAWPWRLIFLEF